jgi:hypothetical protein
MVESETEELPSRWTPTSSTRTRITTAKFLPCLLTFLALTALHIGIENSAFTFTDRREVMADRNMEDDINTHKNEVSKELPGQLVPGADDFTDLVRSEVKTLKRSDFPPEPPSPYELRYPGLIRPHWAKKPWFFQQPIPDDKRLCFVHIGKTAGSTVGCYLGFQLHCEGEMKYPMGLLPKYTSHTTHNGVNDCPVDSAYYLFVVRNPLERLRSAYVYDRPETDMGETLLYRDCPFYFLNDLAEQGLTEGGNASAVCKQRAYNAVRGLEIFGYHLHFNYRYYTNEALGDDRSKKAVLIRNEHLKADWDSIEALLGGKPGGVVFPVHNKAQNKESGDDYLSDRSRHLLCHALCDEIQVYKSLLERAVNLTPEQVLTSMQELSVSCPNEAAATSCPDTL